MRTLSVALILIGITAGIFLSNVNVVSVFKGSHYVTDISGNGNDVDCEACHKKVAEEMAITRAIHGPHWDLSCEACHRFNGSAVTQFAMANGGTYPGKEAHAAYVPKCLDCHGGDGVYVTNVTGGRSHADPARAFNLTPIPNYTAHKQFFEYCKNLGDENLACLACHSNYSIDIDYRYHHAIRFNTSTWTLICFAVYGQRQYDVTFLKISVFSGKHVFLPTDRINCSRCHENVYEALIGSGENCTHAPIKIDAKWDEFNYWNDPRFHYIPSQYVPEWINNTYCNECHFNPSIPDTAASKSLIHCAEKVSCLTCHGPGKYADPSQVNATHGNGTLFNDIANKPRVYHGDICMGCHTPAVHPENRRCGWCHGGKSATVDIYIESEPTGIAVRYFP